MNRLTTILWGLLALTLAPAVAAQGAACPAIVQAALQAADAVCAPTGRNQACYGNLALDAEPQPHVTRFDFSAQGDIVPVSSLHRLRTLPMDVQAGTWGIALLRLQANLPDTLPGQNVTFLLFGDAEMTSAVEPGSGFTPMQAFRLRSSIGDAQCQEAPDSGLLVQTPHGVDAVMFHVNGVEVSMGSTVYLRAQPAGEMIVSTVEGSAFLRLDGEIFPVIAGTGVRLALDRDLRPVGRPLAPRPYDEREIRALPLRALPRAISARPALTEPEMAELQRRIQNRQPLCGAHPFPACPQRPGLLRELLLNRDPALTRPIIRPQPPTPTPTPETRYVQPTPAADDSSNSPADTSPPGQAQIAPTRRPTMRPLPPTPTPTPARDPADERPATDSDTSAGR
jgi:hypothetical protein